MLRPDAVDFTKDERVIIHGLVSEKGRAHNLQPARVVAPRASDDGRVGVRLLHGARATLGGEYRGPK